MEPWKFFRPVVADSHHFDEEQIRIWIRIKVKSWIRVHIEVKSWIGIKVRIKAMRIRNLEYYTVDQMLWNVAIANTTFYQF
jgi:hypothetical protein